MKLLSLILIFITSMSFSQNDTITKPNITFVKDSLFIGDLFIGKQEITKESGKWHSYVSLYNIYLKGEISEQIKEKCREFWMVRGNKNVIIHLKEKLDKEKLKKEKLEQEKLEQEKLEQARQYLELYRSTVSNRLKESKDPKEGIYKSIDNGEKYEYDIVILEDQYSLGDYKAYIWSSTDNELVPSLLLFTFFKTAIKDKYIASYSLKNGEYEENKLASFNEGILNMSIKSFIKMFPTNDDKATYQEIIPNTATGSGFFIHESGIVATNHHVIKGAKTIDVIIKNDNKSFTYKADIVITDEQNDIALLKINDENFTSLQSLPYKLNSNSDVGEKCFTIGFPMTSSMGINQKLTDGIVSSKTGYKDNPTQYQISVPIQPGNSGGALFDVNGDVIGLTSSGIRSLQNVGYAVKISYLITLYNQLTEKPELSLGKSEKDKDLKDSYKKVKDYVCLIKVNL